LGPPGTGERVGGKEGKGKDLEREGRRWRERNIFLVLD